MLFTLEALAAGHGDSLLLHYADGGEEPQIVLIDGGPEDIFAHALRPRLEAIARNRDLDPPVELRLTMVSHIDGDHITGILELLEHGADTAAVDALWHNSFDDVIGNAAALEALGQVGRGNAAAFGTDQSIIALAAGVAQGRQLRDLARDQGLLVNAGAGDFVAFGDRVDLGNGLLMRIVGPDRQELAGLREKWDDFLASIAGLPDEDRLAKVARFADTSPANLSSIVVYATMGGRSMLLTGDARGDVVLRGLEDAGLMNQGRCHVDLLKIPHHGSDRNVTTGFFRQVTADHYVFSGDGTLGGNPDISTLRMLTRARGAAHYRMVFTYRLPKLEEFFEDDLDENERNYQVTFRDQDALGVAVDLGDEALDY